MQGRYFRQVINKFMVNSEVANNARVQVYMPNGETLVSSALYKDEKLYEGSRIQQLVACGLRLEACCLKLETIYKKFQSL
jgi:hypothetical protein